MAVTYTTNYNLSKYDAGDTGWNTGVNDNFDTIDSLIKQNADNISTNATNISNNATNISNNATNISNNTDNISTNATNISNNATNISDLDSRVTTNETNIHDLYLFKGDNFQSISSVSGTATIDWNNGYKATITLTEDTSISFINLAKAGIALTLIIKQDSTGGWTLTLPTIKWVSGNSPSLSTNANNISIVTLLWDGTNYYGIANDNFA